ncbi:MAG: type II secretion system F family protein, partial [Chthoniobacterales bacterium]
AAIWLIAAGIAGAAKRSRGVDRWLMRIPVIGGVRVALVGSRFCRTLGILVRSGGGILRSLDRAGAVCGSGLFRDGATEVTAAVRSGEPLTEAVDETRAFPDLIANGIAIGEQSGRLDDEMDRVGSRYDELLNERLAALAAWIPRIIFFIVAALIGWKVIEFYLGYIGSLNKLLEGM